MRLKEAGNQGRNLRLEIKKKIKAGNKKQARTIIKRQAKKGE